ncbi:cytochrome b [Parathalassolituus penaei]|uniref:Cytochrome b n=1 Tax=Parathalassolituus penaei TaxID=2997323 RepID=A0A9X3IT34_9GAMM|nr:cytochrome b [Parathalassolituus penaei]MCY0967057.1 cytochrome b [Parathalassolituus penaei]
MSTEIRNYNAPSKIMHWLSALMIAGLLGSGMIMEELSKGEFKTWLMGNHKAIGAIFLLVVLVRFAVRFSNPVDPLPGTERKDYIKAKALQGLMYVSMLVMPLSGILMSQSGGRVISVFGLFDVPTLIGENHDLHEFLEGVHGFTANVLLVLIALHIAAALLHHFKMKDDTLRRMV